MTEEDAQLAVDLCTAISELPKVYRGLSEKPGRYHDSIWLEMSAAEMNDGEGQGSNHYFYVPPKIGRAILDAAEKIIKAEIKRLKVTPKRPSSPSQARSQGE